MRPYVKRTIEDAISRISVQFPVTVLTGPRQVGKSTLLINLFPSYTYISFDDTALRWSAKNDPVMFVENLPYPVIIDEAQYVPEILPLIKMHVDRDRVNGRFILTGSQVFNLMAGLSESLAGRACLFEMLPFSFEELTASGLLPVPRLFADCCRQMMRGFYPVPNIENTDSNAFYGAYLPLYIERDLRQIKNIGDIASFERFLRILAARAGNLLNIANLARDCDIAHVTAKNWLSLLENSRIIYLLKPYYANIAKRLIKSPKVYFTDTGLLLYLMKYSDAETLTASPAAGAVFENMIIMEFLKKKINRCSTEDLFFYRDSNGVEIDLVIDKGPFRELYEIKATKTLRPDMALSLSRVEIGAAKKALLSFYENTLPLGSGITALPWWIALDSQPSAKA